MGTVIPFSWITVGQPVWKFLYSFLLCCSKKVTLTHFENVFLSQPYHNAVSMTVSNRESCCSQQSLSLNCSPGPCISFSWIIAPKYPYSQDEATLSQSLSSPESKHRLELLYHEGRTISLIYSSTVLIHSRISAYNPEIPHITTNQTTKTSFQQSSF